VPLSEVRGSSLAEKTAAAECLILGKGLRRWEALRMSAVVASERDAAAASTNASAAGVASGVAAVRASAGKLQRLLAYFRTTS